MNLEATDKILSYEKLKENCILNSGQPVVFGEGNLDAWLMMVGEAPGATEVQLGRPFVGKAGANLNEFIEVVGLERNDLYITNTVKIRPFKINEDTGRISNRPPNTEEISKYEKYLYEEIAIVQPKLIVTLGNKAMQTVIRNTDLVIGTMHGMPTRYRDILVFPLYHPAAVIYNRELKATYMEDLEKLKKFISEENLYNKKPHLM